MSGLDCHIRCGVSSNLLASIDDLREVKEKEYTSSRNIMGRMVG